MKIEIRKSEDGQYYWCTLAKNGQVVLTSETYKRKQSVWSSITGHFKSMGLELARSSITLYTHHIYATGNTKLIKSINIIDKSKEA